METDSELAIYLRDHYAAGVGAIALLEHCCKIHRDDEALHALFESLRIEVEEDHAQLCQMMQALEIEPSGVRDAGAWLVEKLSQAKLGFSGGGKADLRLLQTLESLLLGVTGKGLLWRALRALRDGGRISLTADFDRLEARAKDQLQRLEARRLDTVRGSLGG